MRRRGWHSDAPPEHPAEDHLSTGGYGRHLNRGSQPAETPQRGRGSPPSQPWTVPETPLASVSPRPCPLPQGRPEEAQRHRPEASQDAGRRVIARVLTPSQPRQVSSADPAPGRAWLPSLTGEGSDAASSAQPADHEPGHPPGPPGPHRPARRLRATASQAPPGQSREDPDGVRRAQK